MFPCPACGHLTIETQHDWDICPVCFWEDDVGLNGRDDVTSPANRDMSLAQAQANYYRFGAIDLQFTEQVRPPTAEESRPEGWVMLPKAVSLLRESQLRRTEM
ncbi:CPCC family cysteine-rich protein [Tuwongella immobilis]|uniref:Cysteine-rich CPCC domain-containing protein n=1 Tax=Tuwongella immobilis TaxID=692036 RepID=A0A6C2YL48_9BACT|nr:CPCC family cysteine-rich protein [Tuwongella immobilis]VIP01642.1 Membrane protein OS=Clostridium sp. HMP27 GN=DP68_16305 PE=4 SV=1: Cys_rich_CPCC [Tuwongella immobilis]VTR99014.1 Membrane protein OS=Clostridium sp. HMP27 GN=DP68_16305 PE=4 SV=1: Cys_rich_CPCC [Tuwongella immobilis]